MAGAFDTAAFCPIIEQDVFDVSLDQNPSFRNWGFEDYSPVPLEVTPSTVQSQGSFSRVAVSQHIVSYAEQPAFPQVNSNTNSVPFQQPIRELMDLVISLRSTSADTASQSDLARDVWLRDDDSIFTSLNLLCDMIVEIVEIIDALSESVSLTSISVLSQVQTCFYLTHEACLLITNNLQNAMMNINSRCPNQPISQRDSYGRPPLLRNRSCPVTSSSMQPLHLFQLGLVDRLQNTIHLTGSKFQINRLLAHIESVIHVIIRSERLGSSLSMVSVDDMRNECSKMRTIGREIQIVIDVLKSSDHYRRSEIRSLGTC